MTSDIDLAHTRIVLKVLLCYCPLLLRAVVVVAVTVVNIRKSYDDKKNMTSL